MTILIRRTDLRRRNDAQRAQTSFQGRFLQTTVVLKDQTQLSELLRAFRNLEPENKRNDRWSEYW